MQSRMPSQFYAQFTVRFDGSRPVAEPTLAPVYVPDSPTAPPAAPERPRYRRRVGLMVQVSTRAEPFATSLTLMVVERSGLALFQSPTRLLSRSKTGLPSGFSADEAGAQRATNTKVKNSQRLAEFK